MLIHKIQGWPQTTKSITSKKKSIKISKDDRQQYQRLPLAITRTVNDDNNQQYFQLP